MNPHVSSEDLQPVLETVKEYPVTSDELASRAQELGAGEQVVEFFESIPADTMFSTESEVLSMAEQIEDPTLTVSDAQMDEDMPGYE